MSLRDVQANDVEDGAQALRRTAIAYGNMSENLLTNFRNLISTHGRAALVAELGTQDAQDLLTVYNSAKSIVELIDERKSIPNLPA